MAASFTSSVFSNRGVIWKEIQNFASKKTLRNSRAQIYTTTKNGKCDIIMRELDKEGNLLHERVLSIDTGGRALSFNSSFSSETKDFTPPPPPFSHKPKKAQSWIVFEEKKKSKMSHIRDKVKKKLTPNLYDWSLEESDSDTPTITDATSDPPTWNNDDDDLYDMPSQFIPMKEVKRDICSRPKLAKSSSSTLRSRFSMSSNSTASSSPASSVTLQEENKAEETFDNDDDQVSISDASVYSVRTQATVSTSYSTNNDFLEYERRLRESELRLHNLQTHNRILRKPISAASQSDTQSTASFAAPSLSYSTRSAATDASSSAPSLASSGLDTPYASDVSTLDGSSIVFNDDYSMRSSHPQILRSPYH